MDSSNTTASDGRIPQEHGAREWTGVQKSSGTPDERARLLALYEAVTSTSVDFMYVFDRQGRFQYANKRLLEVWGLTLAQVVGKTCLELGYERWHHDMHMREIAQVLETRQGIRGEVPFTAPRTGISGVYEYIFSPVLDAKGEVELVAGTTRDVTARKRAEDLLKESESRFRGLATASADVMYRMSPDWKVMYPLDGRGLVPSSSSPLEGWMELNLPASEHARVKAAIAEAIANKAPFEIEHRVKRPDGTLGWTFSRAVPILDAKGEIREWFGAAADISQRRRAEEAQHEIDARYRLVNLATNDVIWDWDLVNSGLLWNESLERVFGYELANVPQTIEWWYEHLHPDDRDRVVSQVHAAIESGKDDWEGEYRFLKADGTYARVIDRGHVLRSNGRSIRMIGSMLDLTERLAAEQALRESEERFRAMADGLPLMVWVHGPGGELQFVNHTYCEFFGVTREEMKNGRWTLLVHPEDEKEYAEAFFRCNAERLPFHGVARVQGTAGEWRSVESWGRPRFSGDGEYLGMVGASADITTRLETEKELESYRWHLETMIQVRSLQLEESSKRLRDSERLLSLGTLTAGLGHDLHNALLPLRVHVEELLAASKRDPSIRENASAIEAVTSYLASLSRGMRMLSKDPAQAGESGTTDLAEWEKSACRVLNSAVSREVGFSCRVPTTGLPLVAVADHRLTQAVFNLVQNGRDAVTAKFGASRGGKVEVIAENGEPGWVVISVRDNGIGMDEETRRRCVEPFFTTKVRGARSELGGTGMGLSLVSAFVGTSGGRLEVESTPKEGSVFRLLLPAVSSGEQSSDAATERGRLAACVTIGDTRFAAAVRAVLSSNGWTVTASGTNPTPFDGNAVPTLWVTEAVRASPDAVRAFTASNPLSHAIVLVSESVSADGYERSDRVRTFDPSQGFRGLRAVLESFSALQTRPSSS